MAKFGVPVIHIFGLRLPQVSVAVAGRVRGTVVQGVYSGDPYDKWRADAAARA